MGEGVCPVCGGRGAWRPVDTDTWICTRCSPPRTPATATPGGSLTPSASRVTRPQPHTASRDGRLGAQTQDSEISHTWGRTPEGDSRE
jgi:hypothetical protein